MESRKLTKADLDKVSFLMRCIMHYTNPGDIVYDGLCGTGMADAGLSAPEFVDYHYW